MSEILRIRQLAGLSTDRATMAVLEGKKKQLSDVVAKVEVPDGTFTKKAGAIVKTLLKLHDGDVGKSIKALSFYMNRAGKDCENKDQLDAAKEQLKAKNLKESFDLLRKLSGMTPIVEKKEKAEGDDTEAPADDEEAEDDIPAIIKKIAKKAEGKSGEDLEALLQKVYDAGFKDGQAEAAEGEDGKEDKVEEGKKHKAKPVDAEVPTEDIDAEAAPKKEKKADKEEVVPAVKK